MKALAGWVGGLILGWIVFGLVARILAELFLIGWRLI